MPHDVTSSAPKPVVASPAAGSVDVHTIRRLLVEVQQQFPRALWTDFLERDVLHVQLAFVPNGTMIDLGGGYSPLSAVLVRLGMKVTVVDTFASTTIYEQFSAQELCDVLQSFGVRLVKADLRTYDPAPAFEPDSVDAICCFGTILFFNPRQLIDRCMRVLKPGGKLLLDCVNAASALRRLRVLRGRHNTDRFHDYFFHGWHTRFWVRNDMLALGSYLKLSDYSVLGRNWSVYESRTGVPRWTLRVLDTALRSFPGLCNDLYLVGKK
jgi:SAM-dependent methyltransferase